jgi:hypothetical protein
MKHTGTSVVPLLLLSGEPMAKCGIAYRYHDAGDVNVVNRTEDSAPVPVVATGATALLLKTQQVQEGEDQVPIRR